MLEDTWRIQQYADVGGFLITLNGMILNKVINAVIYVIK